MMADPLVSIAIPVRNGERFLRQALDSVLDQTYRPIEVIVVDDGSTDATPEIVKQYGAEVRYLFQNHQGLPAGRNRGIAAANGEYLAFLAHDDLFTPDKLEIQVGYLAAHPETNTRCRISGSSSNRGAAFLPDFVPSCWKGTTSAGSGGNGCSQIIIRYRWALSYGSEDR